MRSALFTFFAFFVCFGSLHANEDDVSQKALSLDDAVQKALQSNPSVQSFIYIYKKAKNAQFESVSKWLPELTAFTEGYTTERKDPVALSKSTYLTQFSLTQSIFDTKKYYGVRIATLKEDQMKLLLYALMNDVIYDVKLAYNSVILHSQRLFNAKENVRIAKDLSQAMHDRYKIGTSTLLNVSQSKVALANAETKLFVAKSDLKKAQDALLRVLGEDSLLCPAAHLKRLSFDFESLPISKNLSSLSRLFAEDPLEPVLETMFQKGLKTHINSLFKMHDIMTFKKKAEQRNPSFLAQKTWVAINQAIENKHFGEYLPSINILANVGGTPTPYEDYPAPSIGHQNLNWGAGIKVSWLLFDGFGRESRIRQATNQRKSSVKQVDAEKLKLSQGIGDAVSSIQEATSALFSARSTVQLAKQALTQAKEQLEIGYISIYDYEHSIDELIQAMNAESNAGYELMKQSFTLQHITGEDIKTIKKQVSL